VVELDVSPASAIPAPATRTRAPAVATIPDKESDRQRVVAYVAGAFGASALVAGFALGGSVLARKGAVEDNCAGAACNAEGKAAADGARSMAVASNVAFGAGAGALALGGLLLLTSGGASRKATPRVRAELVPTPTGAAGRVLGVW
jgi:hypothetical protein